MDIKFRSDIQGLRALAVVVVLASHAGLPLLAGGFVGVDVFFVVSGFLITAMLVTEASKTDQVSLRGFWSRRARRILPAATVVTVATVLTALTVMSFIDARDVVIDAVWGTLFAANINFALQDLSYFAQSSDVSPLQHYWSLAVEEQFYLVWPLLIIGVLAVARRRRAARKAPGRGVPRRALFLTIALLSGASLGWSLFATSSSPESAYFSTLTRAWELGVGAMVALLAPSVVARVPRYGSHAMAAVGLVAILTACVRYDDSTPFPGWAATLPVLGTALLLVAGMGPHSPFTNRLWEQAAVQRIGDWSYSLYLWHWPMLVLGAAAAQRDLTWAETTVAMGATVALAGLSYRFVEQPFRTGGGGFHFALPKPLLLYPTSLALVGVVALTGWQWTGYQAAERGNNPPITAPAVTNSVEPSDPATETVNLVRASVDAAREDFPVPSDLSPDLVELRDSVADVGECDYDDPEVRLLCPRGDPDGDQTLVVIGDSHARAWIPAFERITEGWTAYYLVKPQCTPAHVTVAPLNDDAPFTECDDFQEWVSETVEELQPELVVVTSSPPVNGLYVGEDRYESVENMTPVLAAGYDELFNELLEITPRVVLLRDVPKSADDPGSCLSQRDPSLKNCLFTPVERSRALGNIAVQAAELAGTEIIDPTPWLCYEGECPVVIGGTLTYRDTNHLTTEYAAALARPLAIQLRLPEPED